MNGTATTCPSAEAHDDGRDFFRSAKALLPRINSGAPTGAEHTVLHRVGFRGWSVEFVFGRGLVGAYLACGYFGAEVIFGADGGACYASEGVDLAYVGQGIGYGALE
jgi:hypothetical protein